MNQHEYFNILNETNQSFSRFNTFNNVLKLNFNHPTCSNVERWLELAMGELLEYIKKNTASKDKISLEFTNEQHRSFFVSCRNVENLNTSIVFHRLSKVLQSNSSFFLNGNFNVNVTHVAMPVGYA